MEVREFKTKHTDLASIRCILFAVLRLFATYSYHVIDKASTKQEEKEKRACS